MKSSVSFFCLALSLVSLNLSAFAAGKTPSVDKSVGSVEALLYTTLPSTAAHRPEMAMDGDSGTYFRSTRGMDDGDDFLVFLSRPVAAQSLHVVTGDADGQDLLTNGTLETSPDTVHYQLAAAFNSAGVADAALHGQPVQALRIRVKHGQGISALLVREIALTSPVPISHVQWAPGRGFFDVSQAPDVAAWAQRAETQMEEFWPDTDALLYSDKFIPPNMVHVVYRTGADVPGVAATGGGVMTVNADWCRQHPDDTGLTVHETAHVVQAYDSYTPGWLVEGIADYVRWVRFEPEHFHPRLNPQKATYHDAYQTSATFLGWCELHYDSRLVTKLNQAMRFGNYSNDLFQKCCGKDVDALWAEFLAAYQRDPVNIITTPLAAADRPRTLPAVKAGTSASVNLSAAFNATGLSDDRALPAGSGGIDGEGNAYSTKLLGAALAGKDVLFQPGPPNAPDVISCQGATLPLPTGQYTSLWLLGTGVEGAQKGQIFRVTYTDGTTEDLAQNLSDWFEPQNFPGETRAVAMPYRLLANGTKDTRTFYVYRYGFPLQAAKTVQSLTLPTNENVKLLAVTLAN